jgi:Protein of unknown function (DUF3297)
LSVIAAPCHAIETVRREYCQSQDIAAKALFMTDKLDTPPDRLSIHPYSDYYDEAVLVRGIGIKFKGEKRTTVEEYCISEGWIKVQAGKSLDRKGRPLQLTLKGEVEAWFEDLESPTGDDKAK